MTMKTTGLMAMLAVSLMALNGWAEPAGDAPAKDRDGQRAARPGVQRLMQSLDLTKEQQEKVKGAMQEIGKKQKALQEEMKPKMEALQRERMAKMKEILTAEQYSKLEKKTAALKERVGRRGGDGRGDDVRRGGMGRQGRGGKDIGPGAGLGQKRHGGRPDFAPGGERGGRGRDGMAMRGWGGGQAMRGGPNCQCRAGQCPCGRQAMQGSRGWGRFQGRGWDDAPGMGARRGPGARGNAERGMDI